MCRLPTYPCVGLGQNVVQAYVTQCEARSLGGEAYSTKETVPGGVLGDVSELWRLRVRERMCVFPLLETWKTLSQEFLIVAEIPEASAIPSRKWRTCLGC